MTRIFLVGARGCGKTSLGRMLALHLGWQCIDTDELVQQQAGRSVADMVADDGWQVFRDAESAALELVCGKDCVVVATGGGMVLRQENRLTMRSCGVVLYLWVPAETLARRLGQDPDAAQRPSLTGRPLEEEIADILAGREALYRHAAHYVVDGQHGMDEVLADICRTLARAGCMSTPSVLS